MSLKPSRQRHSVFRALILVIVVIGAIVFKWASGSFLVIGDRAKRELLHRDVEKTKASLDLESLTESSIDIVQIGASLQEDLALSEHQCVKEFETSVSNTSSDSAFLLVMTEILEQVDHRYHEKTDSGWVTIAYPTSKGTCTPPLEIVMVNCEDGESRISEVKNFDNFLVCSCDNK
jgi:hypothetical protein